MDNQPSFVEEFFDVCIFCFLEFLNIQEIIFVFGLNVVEIWVHKCFL